MRKLSSAIRLIIIAWPALLVISCSTESCFDETESRVKASLYSYEEGKLHSADSITLFGIGMDTNLIYDKSLNLNKIELPLYAEEISCTFIIRINGINDTLMFSYSSYPHLLSKECGYTFFFTLDTATCSDNNIDSISFINRTITTFDEENIRIFY